MIKWLLWVLLLLMPVAQAAPTFPSLTGRVVDQANLLSPTVRLRLSQMLAAHETATTNQVVVVTVNSLQGYAIEQYGVDLGRHWGIGQKDKNNGVLLIIAPNERKIRIEVGYGLEGTLTDALSSQIVHQQILPHLRNRNMPQGIIAGATAIVTVLDNKPLPRSRARSRSSLSGVPKLGAMWRIAAVVALVLIAIIAFIKGHSFIGSWSIITIILMFVLGYLILAVILALVFTLFTRGGGGGYYGGYGGYSSGGYSGGGGFSGGGGSFGGGGASGGW